MKRVLLVCVNYNSYKELSNFYNSVVKSVQNKPDISVDILVADNSTKVEKLAFESTDNVSVKHVNYPNIGYLGAAQRAIAEETDVAQYDYVAISNVDLKMDEDFFSKLVGLKIEDDIAWVATKIWSEDEGRDRNPKVMQRYSKRKLQLINLMYRIPILDWLYTNTMYKKKAEYAPSPECDLYAGHGSFMLLTKTFFKHYKKIEYPIFLFGEELYLAELIRKAGLRVHYVPELVVRDMEHVSTGKMKKTFYYKCNKESIDYILNTFYNE